MTGGVGLVELYARLIINKRRAFSQVPARFQTEVEARLRELGYNTSGEPITEAGGEYE